YLRAHDLSEPSIVRVAGRVDLYVGAVLERDLPVEELLHFRPPLALFWLVVVRPSLCLRREADEHEELTVFGDAARGSKPTSGMRTELVHPSVDHGSNSAW